MKATDRLLRLAGSLQRAQLLVAAAALVILMMVTVLDVFLRYVFIRPIRGSYDTVETMLLVFVFNGMAAAFYGRRNIVIDLFDILFGARAAAVMIRVADLLSVICLGVIIWAMIQPLTQAYQYGDVKLELRVPIYMLWAIAIVSLTATLSCALVTLVAKPVIADSRHSG